MRPPRLPRAPRLLRNPPRLSVRAFHPSLLRHVSSQITTEEVDRSRAYCADLVKTHDHPSHILQTFIPPSARDAYLALRAFNIDIANVASTTSTPSIGQMRLQFWRDTVTRSLAGTPPKEPVALLLAHAQQTLYDRSGGTARFSRSWFLRSINARAQYLGNSPYPTLEALESYAENTYATLLYLTLEALPQVSVTTDHIASHIGKAVGIAAVLRGIPFVAFPALQPLGTSNSTTGACSPAQGAVLLPLDIMADAGVKEEDVFRQGGAAPGLRDAVFAVATRANDHLITAREMLFRLRADGTVGHEFEHQHEEDHHYSAQELSTDKDAKLAEVERAFGVFMPAASTQSWLDRLQKADFDIFDQELRKQDWKLPWKAYWAFSRRKL